MERMCKCSKCGQIELDKISRLPKIQQTVIAMDLLALSIKIMDSNQSRDPDLETEDANSMILAPKESNKPGL